MQFERGEPMVLTLTRDAGLFFLNIETGAVEGWTGCGRPAPSPGNRFVLLESPEGIRLIDRLEGRTFAWDSPELSLVHRVVPRWPLGDYTPSLLGWGTGASEHLVFRWGNAFAVVDASLEAIAWFELDDMVDGTEAPGLWLAHPEGKYLARYRSSGALTSVNLMTGEHRSAKIPAPPRYSRRMEVQTLSGGEGLAAISQDEETSTCTVTRFGWDLAVLSEASMLCIQAPWLGVDLAPDGKWVATVTLLLGQEPDEPGIWSKLAVTSLFDAVTGEELLRVHGTLPSNDLLAVHDDRSRWLADSSGLVLETRTEARILKVDGSWSASFARPEPAFGPATGFVIPSSDDPALFDRPLHLIYQPCASDGETCRTLSARVTGSERDIATAQLILQAAPNAAWRGGPGWTTGVFAGAYNRTSWGLSSGELRVHLTSGGPYEGLGYIPSREPRVERPPFFDATTLSVATGDSCGHLRNWVDAEAASLACLPADTVVESVKPPPDKDYVYGNRSSHLTWSYGYWIHVRTDEGIEGWMHSDDLVGWQPSGSATVMVDDDAPTPATFRYDSFGPVWRPGTYVFLANPDDLSTAITTYEGLRDGSTTALLIHTADADGVSRADTYDAVEVGDLFEWRQADDCFVRYTVTEIRPEPAGTEPRRLLAVEWMTYAFTGCSGAIAADGPATLKWGELPDLGGDALVAPVVHGIYQIIPPGWEGETVDLVLDFSGPGQPGEYRSYSTLAEARLLPYWRDPALPEGWILDNARIGFEGPRNGYCANFLTEERTRRRSELRDEVYRDTAFMLCGLSITGWYHPQEAVDRNSVTETRVVAGRPAVVRYGRNSHYHISIEVYDPETGSEYEFNAHDSSIGGSNPEPALAIVQGLFDGELSYDLDTTGAVTTAGSYSFMGEAEDGSTVPITTYEGLRDGSTTSLVIHKTYASGASRTATLDRVRAGDLVEWHMADDCFVRYRITDVKAEPPGTTFRKDFGVEWMTYAFTGCSGAIPGDTIATLDWGELPDLGGTSLTAPVVHGVYQIAPAEWTGEVVPWGGDYSPNYPELKSTTDIAEARKMRHWREPAVPAGWTFRAAAEGGHEVQRRDGYAAWYVTADGEEGFELRGAYGGSGVSGAKEAAWHGGRSLRETRVVAGRPAVVIYSKASRGFPLTLWVYDPATQVQYTIYGQHGSLQGGNVDAVIAIAESLFAEQAAPAAE